jgi:hypothetical protein
LVQPDFEVAQWNRARRLVLPAFSDLLLQRDFDAAEK